MSIKITSDSTCDLSQELLAAHGIELFPLSILKENKAYRDGAEIVPADIFAHVANGGTLCSTAAVNLADYMLRFGELSRKYDAVIHFDISSEFSSCFQNARLASAELPNVYVIDSRSLSTGQGLLVLAAAEMAGAGMEAGEIVRRVREMTEKVEASFLIDRLDYLKKGGRCSSVAMLGANLLRLRPCIEVSGGKMQVGKKYRGQFEKCVREYVTERLTGRMDLDTRRIFITHTPVPDGVLAAAREAVRACADFEEIFETEAGCTVSCHCGPGTLGILFLKK